MMNERDMNVLNILAQKGEPLTAMDIVAEKESLTQNTVMIVLRKLLKEKLVEVTGFTYSGRALSRTYILSENAREAVLRHMVEQFHMCDRLITVDDFTAALEQQKEKEKRM